MNLPSLLLSPSIHGYPLTLLGLYILGQAISLPCVLLICSSYGPYTRPSLLHRHHLTIFCSASCEATAIYGCLLSLRLCFLCLAHPCFPPFPTQLSTLLGSFLCRCWHNSALTLTPLWAIPCGCPPHSAWTVSILTPLWATFPPKWLSIFMAVGMILGRNEGEKERRKREREGTRKFMHFERKNWAFKLLIIL